MLFNSYEFIFAYLPLVLGGFFLAARRRPRIAAAWLALASVFFYGWWNPACVALLLGSVLFNYGAGRVIARHVERGQGGRARAALVAAIGADLGLLGVFKYADFFVASADRLGAGWPLPEIVLPAGISFFTFTQIAYLVDTRRGLVHEADLVHYLVFVTWFPHLIAGPVLHHKQMMPQFARAPTYRPQASSLCVGLTLFSFGLFKKVLLADQFARFANPVFDGAAAGARPMLVAAWSGALAYALQLYFDFSGYSDMAIGLSRLFNIRLPLNFDSPYKAASLIDFWRRWHMSLSAFLRDYLYLPLGGNRKGPLRRHVNLLLTMLLGGLWHGAGWNFVLWGGLHGVGLVANHAWRHLRGEAGAAAGTRARGAGRVAGVLLTFAFVVIAWVPFRATSMAAAGTMLAGLAGLNGVSLPQACAARLAAHAGGWLHFDGLLPGLVIDTPDLAGWLAAGLLVVWALPNSQQWLASHAPAWNPVAPRAFALEWQPTARFGVLMGAVFALAVLSFTRNSPFLYFQF